MTRQVTSVYTSPRARRDFWLFCVATFLGCLTSSTIAYLSVILSSLGVPQAQIGMILSSPLVPVTFAILLSGPLISRFSALGVMLCGQLISLLAFLSLQWDVANPVWAGAGRVLLGLGFGMFFPAALVYAKSKLQGPKTAYLFGIAASMVPLPNIVGPPLAEAYFLAFGIKLFFVVFALPLMASILMLMTLGDEPASNRANASRDLEYWRLLTMRSIGVPLYSVLVVGLAWGFVVSFMSLLLHRRGLNTVYFFSTCTATLFFSRFVILGLLVRTPKEAVVALGLALMAASFFVIGTSGIHPIVVVAAGVAFGLGYSVAFPVLSVWVSDQFRAEQRGKPVALLSALFQFGIYAVPYIVASSAGILSLDAVMIWLSGVAGSLSVALIIAHHWRQHHELVRAKAPLVE